MKKVADSKLLLLILVSIVAVSGCILPAETSEEPTGYQGQEIVCNPPYIVAGPSCCLDLNENKVCDDDEIPDSTIPVPTTTAPITQPPTTPPPTTQAPTTPPPTAPPQTTQAPTISPPTTAPPTTTSTTPPTTTTSTTSTSTTTITTTTSTTTNTYPADGIYLCSQGPSGYDFPHGICQNDCPSGLECEPLRCICK